MPYPAGDPCVHRRIRNLATRGRCKNPEVSLKLLQTLCYWQYVRHPDILTYVRLFQVLVGRDDHLARTATSRGFCCNTAEIKSVH